MTCIICLCGGSTFSYYLCLCTAQDVPVEVCISFGGETLVDPYINVDWNVSCMLNMTLQNDHI